MGKAKETSMLRQMTRSARQEKNTGDSQNSSRNDDNDIPAPAAQGTSLGQTGGGGATITKKQPRVRHRTPFERLADKVNATAKPSTGLHNVTTSHPGKTVLDRWTEKIAKNDPSKYAHCQKQALRGRRDDGREDDADIETESIEPMAPIPWEGRTPSATSQEDPQCAQPGAFSIERSRSQGGVPLPSENMEASMEGEGGYFSPPIIEATLVAPEDDRSKSEDSLTLPVASATVVEETKLWCNIDFNNGRVRLIAVLGMVILLGIAVCLAIFIGENGPSSEAVDTVSSDSMTPSEQPSAIVPTMPSWVPSGLPSKHPLVIPTFAPTTMIWEPIGDDLEGYTEYGSKGGMFGQNVALSSNGERIVVGFARDPSGSVLVPQRLVASVYTIDYMTRNISVEEELTIDNVCPGWDLPDYGAMTLSGNGDFLAIQCKSWFANVSMNAPYFVSPLSLSGMEWNGTMSISMSDDGWIKAISTACHDGIKYFFCCLRVVGLDGTDFFARIQESKSELYPICRSLISGSGHVIASLHGDSLCYSRVTVFEYLNDQADWVQLGGPIVFPSGGIMSDQGLSISTDGRTLAVADSRSNCKDGSVWCTGIDKACFNPGRVSLFHFESDVWKPMGDPFLGHSDRENLGISVSLSGNGSTVVIGSSGYDGPNGENSGRAQVFTYNGSNWNQLGPDIDGQEAGEESGTSVSLSSNGEFVAVGAPKNRAAGENTGTARIFQLVGT